jgi:hypothetical protein
MNIIEGIPMGMMECGFIQKVELGAENTRVKAGIVKVKVRPQENQGVEKIEIEEVNPSLETRIKNKKNKKEQKRTKK